MVYVEARERLVEWLRRQLIGPAFDGSLQRMSPFDRYPIGVLHPVEPGMSGVDPASASLSETADSTLLEDEEEATPDGDDDGQGPANAQPARRRRYVPPSSVGFSFFVRGDARLSITASAARYQVSEDRRGEYERTELDEHTLRWPGGTSDGPVWGGRAGIDVQARPQGDGVVLTVTLFNRQIASADERAGNRNRVEQSLFEARLECAIEEGELAEYPRVDRNLLTEEEQELEFQYRERHIYAVGHGAAVDWDVTLDGRARIRSEFVPAVEVPIVSATTGNDERLLELGRLAGEPTHDQLSRFVDDYAAWIAEQAYRAGQVTDAIDRAAADRLCGRMFKTCHRMRRGVGLLGDDDLVAESFRCANHAMLDQMRQNDRVGGRNTESSRYRWHPFQLAFLLAVMKSAIDEDDELRDVVELIWFPTGGGKTEAYLGLIAFLIVWRRLRYQESGCGTVAFMRYTLRLLTRQQFQRAVRLVCALELMRRRAPDRLGEEPITAGIWVGGAIIPNRFVEAAQLVGELSTAGPETRQKLVLDRCPWCGAPFDVGRSYRATRSAFHFHCVNDGCEFGADPRPLPCNVVDEALYEDPPSLLIGTIDKFARLAWDERTGVFFGAGGGSKRRPPELIIQDELHLVTGPLGSVAGLYEAGLDTLLRRRGVRPKYIASTATIRMAREQVRRLYARDLAVFPPSGLSCDDSYFARTDREKPGRLYVGYLAPLLDQQHCLAPLAASLLMAPLTVFDRHQNHDELLDAWWTQLLYHGSLRSVGNSHNAFVTGVREFGTRLANELRQTHEMVGGADPAARARQAAAFADRLHDTRISQLTSMRTAYENAATFHRMAKQRGDPGCLDAVLATNMVSVGVDVARLALMVVNGQPLTTAEYIQATSRVGRAEVPGLVFANYYRHQARSLSHYESFLPYHESFYRFVEPSSVTPYTHQVRSRALHAALVIAVRHACAGLSANTSAGAFDADRADVKAVVEELTRRCRSAAGCEQADETASHINVLVAQWRDEARRCAAEKRQLNYQASDTERNADRLLYDHEASRPGLWRTLHSMRNVERTGTFRIDG